MPLKPPEKNAIALRHLYFVGGNDYWDIKIRGDIALKWPAHVPPQDAIARIEAAVLAAIKEEARLLSEPEVGR